jgi:hypothetical protein
MKKFFLIMIIFSLILITTLVKNSTKKIEDKIFIVNGNIRALNSQLGDVLLEYNYLSSPEKLLQYQSQYFENDLIQMDITKIKKIIEKDNKFEIINFTEKLKDYE